MNPIIINEHNLIHANDGGNGYHGRCEHCGVALVTDLGYCSWDGLKCIDRVPKSPSDVPIVSSYAQFMGYKWDSYVKLFIKATFNSELDQLTLDEMITRTPDISTTESR